MPTRSGQPVDSHGYVVVDEVGDNAREARWGTGDWWRGFIKLNGSHAYYRLLGSFDASAAR